MHTNIVQGTIHSREKCKQYVEHTKHVIQLFVISKASGQ